MSDYLSNLAVRSLGGGERGGDHQADGARPAIRPRLASLFEPLQQTGRRQPEQTADESANPSPLDPPFDESEHEESIGQFRPARQRRRPSPQYAEDEPQGFSPKHRDEFADRSLEDWRTLLGLASREPVLRQRETREAESVRDTGDTTTTRRDTTPMQSTTDPIRPSVTQEMPRTFDPVGPLILEAEQPSPAKTLSDKSEHTGAQTPESTKERPDILHIIAPSVQMKLEPAVSPVKATEESQTAAGRQHDEQMISRQVIQPVTTRPETQDQQRYNEHGQKRRELLETRVVPGPFRYESRQWSSVEPVLARPRTTVAVKPAGQESLENKSEPPASVIQVTIGRIEVRANPPTAHAQTRQSAPATMSLDDYLKKRMRKGDK